ncbi:sterile alpha motif domain-containing protein 9-like [Hyperolius riggenbachi]|uniref:sterile alpha motif domain-containing protein 9-like n=1 Tax=Hyperolius riggenbachi TaxID=752182 RepID=UPI0035A36883
MDYKATPLQQWTEDHVREWLRSICIKNEYIDKLYEEEVTGPALKEISDDFLRTFGMKQGQIQLLIKKRNELLRERTSFPDVADPKTVSSSSPPLSVQSREDDPAGETPQDSSKVQTRADSDSEPLQTCVQEESPMSPANAELTKSLGKLSLEDQKIQPDANSAKACKLDQNKQSEPKSTATFRPFDKEVGEFRYVKGHVLPPETGVEDLITPCHEYKSLVIASKLDRVRLQTKFAYEVIRFACACMNMRSNGTIHFGVMDSKEDKSYKHGEIIGILVNDPDWYIDALDCIEKCFPKVTSDAARLCIRSPKVIEVIQGRDSEEQKFIVEVDIVPQSNIVKGKVFEATLPKFNEKTNKVIQEKKAMYRRIGAKSEPVSDEDKVEFIQRLKDLDKMRAKAESNVSSNTTVTEDLGRKLSVLMTDDKKYINDSLRYVLVTNECNENHLRHITFLTRLNILCVFDFDPNSDMTGLCAKYKEHHAINIHSLNSYKNEGKMSASELSKNLSLFNQTSWIFCNGRNSYRGEDKPCDESTWVKTKRKPLKKAVSFICDEVLPKGYFIVVFLLLSPVEKPIVDTFHEFFTDLNGMDYILCIAENQDHYKKWASQAQASCSMEILDQRSIVGMQLSHVDATVQNLLPSSSSSRQLSVSTKGVCVLATPDEEKMHSLDVLCENECDNTGLEDLGKNEIEEIETTFYRGGKVIWKHFWLAEKNICDSFIEREACEEVQNILNKIIYENLIRLPVARIKIVHQPGSGGSTVARQILWKKRKELRCAVVKTSFPVARVCDHAVNFRQYDEKDLNQCLPVLLLIEDCNDEYIDDLRDELSKAMVSRKIASLKPCFILFSCKRSNAPENLSRFSTRETVTITHKLNAEEKTKFTKRAEKLKKQFSPESIITFILMSQEFVEQYVTNFVHNVMHNVDHSSNITRLMRYVALLNCYVQNSYISMSHCEAFLGLEPQTAELTIQRPYSFNCFSEHEQARLIFIERVDPVTLINCINIIHQRVAQEVLKQLPAYPQSQIAMDLLREDVLFQHRFGRDEFLGFVRDLLFRRHKISRGDSVDSYMSPLIEHVCDTEKKQEKAVSLLKAAYERLDKDPFLAQQLCRLHYKCGEFEEAKYWIETAKSQLPSRSCILDTEGRLYKKWFTVLLEKKNNVVPLDEMDEFIEYATKAMQCFRAAQKAAKSEVETMNNSGYFGEVEIGCRLLQLLATLDIFPKNKNGEGYELLQYLLTNYIPESIKKPWSKFHNHIKGLHRNIYNALDWISEELSYFQTDKTDEGEKSSEVEEHIKSPRKWLLRKIEVFAKFFTSELVSTCNPSTDVTNTKDSINKLVEKMRIYKLGGGSTTAILFVLSDYKEDRARVKLLAIVELYKKCAEHEVLDDIDLINYIMSNIALGCVAPGSSNLVSFQELRELSKRYQTQRKSFPPSAYLLLLLLYWPDEIFDRQPDAKKDNILNCALETARRLHEIRIKNIQVRKKRSNVLFFLGQGPGLKKFMHRSTVEKLMEGPVNEWRLKWDDGDMGKLVSVQRLLKTVPGFTENGRIYVRGHCEKQRFEIIPMNNSSVPYGNENVTFYLGFTYAGLVAYNINVQ